MLERTITRGVRPWILLVLASVASAAAYADLYTAQDAYNKGDYNQAFKQYEELAQLGQPAAQFDLAVMYARGLGVQQSELNAYAWASVAAENGDVNGKALAAKLRPDLAPGSEKSLQEIHAQFGREALDERLIPKIQQDENAEALERESCRTVHAAAPEFPSAAWQEGVQGGVYAEYTLHPDGSARNARIIYAQPQGVFDAAVRESLLHSHFTAEAGDRKPVHCMMYYDFVSTVGFATAPPHLSAFVQKTRAEAQAGRASSQLLYGLLLSGLPQLNRPRSEALTWYVKAAQEGSAVAQYQVGYSLLTGWGCQRDEKKALEWLRHAADQDQPNAQVALAEHSLRATRDEESAKQAKAWLERAAASGSREGSLYLAALLAAAPYTDVRDPPRALSLVDTALKGVEDDPTAHEILAAGQAASGHFADASASEVKAIDIASRLSWDLAPMKERLARYQSQQPWYGDLLDL